MARNSAAEVCWYLPITRDQFRFSGNLTIVDEAHPDEALRKVWGRKGGGGWGPVLCGAAFCDAFAGMCMYLGLCCEWDALLFCWLAA